MKFSARRLKRMFCEAYFFDKREVFGVSANQVEDAGERIYEWPENRIHSKARDTHASMNLRFPVPDDKVPWKIAWDTDFQLKKNIKIAWDTDFQLKKNINSIDAEGHSESKYSPFFATETDEPHYSYREPLTHNPCGRYSRHIFFLTFLSSKCFMIIGLA